MDKQEIFDRAARHLLYEQRGSATRRGRCAYRGENGTRCAVGALIPDELYDPTMEGKSVFDLLARRPEIEKLLGRENGLLLRDLQDVHDGAVVYGREWDAAELENVRKELRAVASRGAVDPAVLDERTPGR